MSYFYFFFFFHFSFSCTPATFPFHFNISSLVVRSPLSPFLSFTHLPLSHHYVPQVTLVSLRTCLLSCICLRFWTLLVLTCFSELKCKWDFSSGVTYDWWFNMSDDIHWLDYLILTVLIIKFNCWSSPLIIIAQQSSWNTTLSNCVTLQLYLFLRRRNSFSIDVSFTWRISQYNLLLH